MYTVVKSVWSGMFLHVSTGIGWAEEQQIHKSLAAVKLFQHCLPRWCVLTGASGPEQEEPTSLRHVPNQSGDWGYDTGH